MAFSQEPANPGIFRHLTTFTLDNQTPFPLL
jgi:hypothetical protein